MPMAKKIKVNIFARCTKRSKAQPPTRVAKP